MAGWPSSERFRFLYRDDAGEIDRETWAKHASAMLALVFALTLPWLWLRAHIVHDLAKEPLFDLQIFTAYFYSIVYAFALMLVGVSYMNLSAKRFRALHWPNPLGLASLVPLVAFLTGALRLVPILSPSISDLAPTWAIWGAEGIFFCVAAWTAWECGIKRVNGAE
ncbi:MAG: hypothetical protein WB816_13165 [Methylocystis sp.]